MKLIARIANSEEAVNFLHTLRPDGPWVLTAIDPTSNEITTITAKTTDVAVNFIHQHNGKRNLYYTLNVTRTAVHKKPAKTDIAAIEYFHSDLDPIDKETPEQAKARIHEAMGNGFDPKACFVIDTGNGIQGLWRIETRIELGEPVVNGNGKLEFLPEDQAKIADAEARSAELMRRLGGDPSTRNIDRILRLPGTTNLPNKAKKAKGRVPCPTRLLEANDRRYPVEAFEPWVDESEPEAPKEEPEPEPKPNGHSEPGDRLERIIRLGDCGEFQSRNHAVWWVINEMFRRAVPDFIILATILDRNNKISAHVYDQGRPQEYAERQVKEARAKYVKSTDSGGKVHVIVLPDTVYMGEQPTRTPPALIKGVLPRNGVAMLGGQSGTGKTFHGIHLGAHLVPDCQKHFYIDKYRIKRHGGVLYLVLEGKSAFELRCTAAFTNILGRQMSFGDAARLPFCWNSYEPNLFEQGADGLIKLADREAQSMQREFGVDMVAVILDTMGLAARYENEDKAAQVQKVVSGLFRLSDEIDALAIGIDHLGKNQMAGLRGSSAKRGHPDTILSCLCDRDEDNNPKNLRMWFEKVRDGEEGRIVPYRLKGVDMGIDEDGDKVGTCVIEWQPNREAPTVRRVKRHKTNVVLDQAIAEVRLPAHPEVLRDAFYKHHGGTRHTANVAWNRAIKECGIILVDGKLVKGFYTEKGVIVEP
jgi:hypothetical protein